MFKTQLTMFLSKGRMACLAILAVVGVILAVAPADAQSSYRLGSGDQVRITVFGEPDLTGQFAVDGSGVVAFPLVGEGKAAGRKGSPRSCATGISRIRR